MHDGDEPGPSPGCGALRLQQALGVERLTPLSFHPHDVGADAPGHFAEPLAEVAVDTDNGGVARLEQVDEAALHPGAARPRHRECHPVGCLEDGAEPFAHLGVEGQELGVEVAEDGPGQAGRRLGVRVRRPGAEEQQLRDAFSHLSHPRPASW